MQAPPPDDLRAARQPLVDGNFEAAAAIVRAHLSRNPQDPRAWGLLARCLRETGQQAEAFAAAERALALQPNFPAVWLELALLRRSRGEPSAAGQLLRQCLAADPGNSAARWELATLLAADQPDEAAVVLAPLLRSPQAPFPARLLHAQLLSALAQHEAARTAFRALLDERPEHVELLEAAHWQLTRSDAAAAERILLLERLVSLAPSCTRLLNLGMEHQHAGDYAAARRAVDAAVALDPAFLPARWARFQWPPSPAPASDVEADRYCREWDAGLADFEGVDFSLPTNREMAWGCIGQCTAFYRHYIGDEVALQWRYGALVRRMMGALDGGEPMRPLLTGRRRIGVCSSHFREHTVARLFVPLIEALDDSRFEVHVFSLDDKNDSWSRRLRARAQFSGASAEARIWRQRLAEAELDVLVYPEVGMDPRVQALAALRLAPVQIALWGHPVSSGMDSIDLYCAPDALEPPGADARYSERVVRLPGLGHGLREADLPPPRDPQLWQPDPQRIDLLCAQTVFKLLPRQDRLFARILAALPQARLHLLADHRPAVRDWLRARMAPALSAAGADPERQLHIHGYLDHAQYLGLAGVCRLNLDTVGWSGGMSALDLLAQGLPTVCLPGESMRSRQTAALLQRLELPELIARDDDDYVAKVLALAADAPRCAALSATLRERRGRLFAQPATALAFTTLLAGVERDADGSLRLP